MTTLMREIPLADQVKVEGPAADGRWTCSFFAFNTALSVLLYAGEMNASAVRAAIDAVVERCRFLERKLSRFQQDSDIARLNAARGNRVMIAPETYDVLRASLGYCEASQGAFDITVGAALALWDFSNGVVPRSAGLQLALEHVDWRAVELGEGDGSYWARLRDPAAQVDVGGTAKGWIADDMRALFQAAGMENGFVNLGGNVLAFGGKPDGTPWGVGIRNPFDPDTTFGALYVDHGSVVTSGPYERFFEQDGTVYHHILNPRTGFPVETDLASATIVSECSVDGDGYSTTLFALGSKRALELVETLTGMEAMLITNAGEVLVSSGLQL
ncbi:MAG: FAD:protein FMN transferase [Eggerthellaceae bacterium]|nr:FAD:protein FMN transferase [Eggerthellaceae bacterium]